jgi:hypothetical protein
MSAQSMRMRHNTRKGKLGINRLGKLIDFSLTRTPRASAMKACIPYTVRNKMTIISNGLVRIDWSMTLTPVKISQPAHMGKDRIFASSKSVVWVYL